VIVANGQQVCNACATTSKVLLKSRSTRMGHDCWKRFKQGLGSLVVAVDKASANIRLALNDHRINRTHSVSSVQYDDREFSISQTPTHCFQSQTCMTYPVYLPTLG